MRQLLRFAVVIVLAAGFSQAQTFRGAINGTIVDPSGAVVAGAEEARETRGASVARGEFGNLTYYIRFRAASIEVDGRARPQVSRHMRDQVVEIFRADGFEHRRDIGFGMWQESHVKLLLLRPPPHVIQSQARS